VLRINGGNYTIVGILASKGGSSLGNQDDRVLIPISTAQVRLIRRNPSNRVDQILVSATSADSVSAAEGEITAILRAKLPYLDLWNARRRDIARYYGAALAGLDLTVPAACGPDYVAHLYVVRTPRRDALARALSAAGIGSDVHYPVPDHLQESAGAPSAPLPETERCCREVLTLPCFPEMTDEEIARVAAAVRGALEAR
jgi:hypothetical protein